MAGVSSLTVDRSQSNAMNLQVLRRQDDGVAEIVGMASHVVIYEFDQSNQSWKRKDVEGCLFVVKRYSAPRFQIFVNNRLSTTNMAIPIDDRLEVDNIDTFLILRSPDSSYPSGFAIYGVWFYPEDDREKTLKLLTRVVQSIKDPSSGEVETSAALPTSTSRPTSSGSATSTESKTQKPKQQKKTKEAIKVIKKPVPVLQASPTPTGILQRTGKEQAAPPAPPAPAPLSQGKQQQQQQQQRPTSTTTTTGMTPYSKAEGKAAGAAILGMISSNNSSRPKTTTTGPRPSSASVKGNGHDGSSSKDASVSKEQLKQTLISLLDDPQFFEQIYHAYVARVQH